MAKILDKDPFTYQKERESFLRILHRFHVGRGTGYKSFPRLGGREVDLYLLYNRVTQLGGWLKLTDEERWEEIQELFGIPTGCTNSAQALKQIYIRYLSHYEKAHHFGEDPDRLRDDQMDEGSMPARGKKSTGPIGGVPLHYNYGQHNMPDHIRIGMGLKSSKQVASSTGDYKHIEHALLSGLPNEVDFALNVCTLLSNEGRHTIRLDKCPQLLKIMFAHIGIFEKDHGALYRLHENGWKHCTKRNFSRFWYDSVRDREIRKYLAPGSLHLPSSPKSSPRPVSPDSSGEEAPTAQENNQQSQSDPQACHSVVPEHAEPETAKPQEIEVTEVQQQTEEPRDGPHLAVDLEHTVETNCTAGPSHLVDSQNTVMCHDLTDQESPESDDDSIDADDINEVLAVTRDIGLYDTEGQRVLQLAMIIRNLSFEKENMAILSNDLATFRFLLLCIHNKYNTLKQLALDTLSNIALRMVLQPIRQPATQLVFQLIAQCIGSSDKFHVVSGLDTLARLCQVEANEDVICDNLDETVYDDIIRMLTVHDIQIIVYTLEVLYQLSELGEVTTTHIAAVRMAVEMLVNLVTVEAQSYGPESLVGIKVVEHVTTIPVSGETVEPPSQASIQQQMATPQPATPIQTQSKTTPQPSTSQMIGTPTRPKPLAPATMKRPPAVPTPPPRPVAVPTPPPSAPSPSSLTKAAQQSIKPNIDLDSDTLACNWLQTHYDFVGPITMDIEDIPKMELYGEFLTTCGRLFIKNIVNASNFVNCVRMTFPKTESIKVKRPDGSIEQIYRGLRRKLVPLPFPPNTDATSAVLPLPGLQRAPTHNMPVIPSPPPASTLPLMSTQNRAPPPQPLTMAPQINTNGSQLHSPSPTSPTKYPQGLLSPGQPMSPTAYPVMQQVLTHNRGQEVAGRPPTPQSPQQAGQLPANSVLIKSLLANKVSQNITRHHSDQMWSNQNNVQPPQLMAPPQQPFQSYQTQPVVNQQQPVMNQQQPVMNQQQPIMNQQQPIMNQQQPLMNQKQPIMNQQQPIMNQQPMNQHYHNMDQQQPIMHQQQPIMNQQQPVMNQQQFIMSQQQQTQKQWTMMTTPQQNQPTISSPSSKSVKRKKSVTTPPGTPTNKPRAKSPRNRNNGRETIFTDLDIMEDIIESVARQGSLDSEPDTVEHSKQDNTDSGLDVTDIALDKPDTPLPAIPPEGVSEDPVLGMSPFGIEPIEGVESQDGAQGSGDRDPISSKSSCDTHEDNNISAPPVNGTSFVNGSDQVAETNHASGDAGTKLTTVEKTKSQMPLMNGAFHHMGNGNFGKGLKSKDLQVLNNKICESTTTLNSQSKTCLQTDVNHSGDISTDSSVKCVDSVAVSEADKAVHGLLENGYTSSAPEENYKLPQLDGIHDEEMDMETSNAVQQIMVLEEEVIEEPPAVAAPVVQAAPDHATPSVSPQPMQMLYTQGLAGHEQEPAEQLGIGYGMDCVDTQTAPTQSQLVMQEQSQAIQSQPQVIPAQPHMVQGQSQVAQHVQGQMQKVQVQPQVVQGQSQVIQGQPQMAQGQPQVVQGQPQMVQGQPQMVQGLTQMVQGPTQMVQGQTKVALNQPTVVQGQTQMVQAQPQLATQVVQGQAPVVQAAPQQLVSAPGVAAPQQMVVQPGQTPQMVTQSGQAPQMVTQPAPGQIPQVVTQQAVINNPVQIQQQQQNLQLQQQQLQMQLQQLQQMQQQIQQQWIQTQQAQQQLTQTSGQPVVVQTSTATTAQASQPYILPKPGQQTLTNVEQIPAANPQAPQISPNQQQTLILPKPQAQQAQQQVQVLLRPPQIASGSVPLSAPAGQAQTTMVRLPVSVQQMGLQQAQPGQTVVTQAQSQPQISVQTTRFVMPQGQVAVRSQVATSLAGGQAMMPGVQLAQSQAGQTQVFQQQMRPQYIQSQQAIGQPGQTQVVRTQLVQQPHVITAQGQTQVVGQQQFVQRFIQHGQAVPGQPIMVSGQNLTQQQLMRPQYVQSSVVPTAKPAATAAPQMITTQAQYLAKGQLVATSQPQLIPQTTASGSKVTVAVPSQQQMMQKQQQLVSGQSQTSTTVAAPTIQIPASQLTLPLMSQIHSPAPLQINVTPSPISTPPPAPSPQSSRTSQPSPTITRSSTKKKRPAATPSDQSNGKKKKPSVSKSRSSSTESRPPSRSDQASPAPVNQNKYYCQWTGCKKWFDTLKLFNKHIIKVHFEVQHQHAVCGWETCDSVVRPKWSLMTHLQDRHMNDSSLKNPSKMPDPPHPAPTQPAPTQPAPTQPAPKPAVSATAAAAPSKPAAPVYPENAAMQAIRRFAARPPYAEFVEMKEGPVTKHIRLTSALILRNLARYSSLGRSKLKKHEEHLSYVALSAVEASGPISNCLWELHQTDPH